MSLGHNVYVSMCGGGGVCVHCTVCVTLCNGICQVTLQMYAP